MQCESGLSVLKILVTVSLILLAGAEGARTLRVPRIYNALITSDEDLLPSQAYPAVSPVLRPATHFYLPAPAASYQHSHRPSKTVDYRLYQQQEEDILPGVVQVKNNRPGNPDIPDVPPPPIPVGKTKSRGPPPVIPF